MKIDRILHSFISTTIGRLFASPGGVTRHQKSIVSVVSARLDLVLQRGNSANIWLTQTSHRQRELKQTLPVMDFYRRELPAVCISFSSPEGKTVFREALDEGFMECYFRLASQYRTQDDPAFCGLATLVMTLNALEIDPKRVWKGPWRWYHEEMLDCCIPIGEVRKRGITLDQFICLAECNSLTVVTKRHVDKAADIDYFRRLVREATAADNRVLVVSYDRGTLGQTGSGHYSCIGGFHSMRDLVLLFDVARFKYPPHWVPLTLLWDSMKVVDSETGRERGFVLLEKTMNINLSMFRLDENLNALLMLEDKNESSGGSVNEHIRRAWNSWMRWLESPVQAHDDGDAKILEAAVANILDGISLTELLFFLRPLIRCQHSERLLLLVESPFGSQVAKCMTQQEKWKRVDEALSDGRCTHAYTLMTLQASIVGFLLTYPFNTCEGSCGEALSRITKAAHIGLDAGVVDELQHLHEIFSNLMRFKTYHYHG